MEKMVDKKPESPAVIARRIEVARVRRERTRHALLNAAFDLLGHEFGRIHNVDAVADQAGVTRGTFYNHYTSLDELLGALTREITHDFNLKVLDHIGAITSPPEQSAIFLKAYLQGTLASPQWGWSMVNLSLYGPVLGTATLRMSEDNVKRGMKSGDYTCGSAKAGRDIAQGALLAAMATLLREGDSKGYVPGIVRGILLALGVPDDLANTLAKKSLPPIFELLN